MEQNTEFGSKASPPVVNWSQRHEFILHYYNMSIADLTRHLGIGWQTIATVAGSVALLSFGQKGELPIPIAVAAAIFVASWGVLNVMDANYWAVRAIAFLSNVEAIYFAHNERRFFNPYAGEHPPLKLLNSLKYQFFAASGFVLIANVFYIDRVWKAGGSSLAGLLEKRASEDTWTLMFWSLPVLATLWLFYNAVGLQRRRVSNYHDFVSKSPGPGMILEFNEKGESMKRGSAEDLQEKLLIALRRGMKFWDTLFITTKFVVGFLLVSLIFWIAL
ncbi:MAG: hypothetical protein SFU83_23105 [Meiothermus sp.]|nr:hypothetical protein [Meiothermus sp.]